MKVIDTLRISMVLLTALILLPSAGLAQDKVALFDEAAQMVEEQFFDQTMKGLNWTEVTSEHRSRITPDMGREAFAAEVNKMLAQLDTSHTRLITQDSPDWYQLAGVFLFRNDSLAEEMAPYLTNGAPIYADIGVILERRSEGYFASGILAGFPASKSGILTGDRLVSVEGRPFHPIHSFRGRVGQELLISIERRPGEMRNINVTPVLLDGRTMFQDAMRNSLRIFERNGARIAYSRVWSYAGRIYHDILTDALLYGSLKDADALVLDIRGGWGGASPAYLNFFTKKTIEMTSTSRDGETHRSLSGWPKPVVLLVDEGSRSGKELIAFGFREFGIGPIVGQKTAGAAVAGRFNVLSDGSILYIAVSDVQVNGTRLEGRGVAPDIRVPFDPVYAAGADPQLDRAVQEAAALVIEQDQPK